jgi:hypothetical protein
MPRSMQDILDHADELAKRFEDYEPSPEDERSVSEYLLRRAALAQAVASVRSQTPLVPRAVPGSRGSASVPSSTSRSRPRNSDTDPSLGLNRHAAPGPKLVGHVWSHRRFQRRSHRIGPGQSRIGEG